MRILCTVYGFTHFLDPRALLCDYKYGVCALPYHVRRYRWYCYPAHRHMQYIIPGLYYTILHGRVTRTGTGWVVVVVVQYLCRYGVLV